MIRLRLVYAPLEINKMIIIYKIPAGVFILVPSPNCKRSIEEIAKKDVSDGIPYEIVEDDVVPVDWTFRNAFIMKGRTIEVDILKARIIHMERIRRVRNEELIKSDADVTREMENGGVTPALKTKRQALRDIPQTFDLDQFTDADSLKVAWPVELPRET